jgi:hypothetical protein
VFRPKCRNTANAASFTGYQNPKQLSGENTMSKEQKSNKEDKKKPTLSPKEKKAVKKSKKDSKG